MLLIFRGAATALLTPFRPDGSIDLPAWDRLLERQLDAGIAALVVCGTTGEAATLTQDEKLTLLRRAKQAACGHCPVIMGVGTNCTAGSVENAELAAQNGADALLVPGDVCDRYRQSSARGVAFLKEAAGRLPTFFSLGNHETRQKQFRLLVGDLERTGAEVLINRYVRFGECWIGGWYPPSIVREPDMMDQFEKLDGVKVLHMSGITPVLSESCLAMTKAAFALAKEKGVAISFRRVAASALTPTSAASCGVGRTTPP